jgi:hypothetical protein
MIDMIMGLSVIAVAIVGIQLAQRNYVSTSDQVEVNLRAISLGNSVMNIIRMHRFDENATAPWDSTLGTDTGETSLILYDDIDDYNGATWDFSGDGYPGYTVTSSIFSVDLNTSWVDDAGAFTSFKRIIVSIDHPAMDSPVVFSSIMAGID